MTPGGEGVTSAHAIQDRRVVLQYLVILPLVVHDGAPAVHGRRLGRPERGRDGLHVWIVGDEAAESFAETGTNRGGGSRSSVPSTS